MAAPLCLWNFKAGISRNSILQVPYLLTCCRNFRPTGQLHQDEDGVEDESKKESTRKVIDAETSINYLNSEAFVKGYGDKPVWFHYRRNFKGLIPPPTRQNCFRLGKIATASACPICRDEYLVLDFKNIKLLEQFISPYSGEIFPSMKTGLCQKQHHTLVAEVMKARDEGLIEAKLPFRAYDYDDYKS